MEHSLTLSQSNNLSPLSKEIIAAQEKTQIRFYQPSQRTILASKIYFTAKAKLGLNDTDKAQETMVITLLSEDLAQLGTFTEPEVLIALRMGLNGDFLGKNDTQVFFNSSNFMIWMKSYLRFRQEAYAELNRNAFKFNVEPKKPEPSELELKKQAITCANDYADSVKKGIDSGREYVFPYGGLNVLCKYLVQFGLYKPDRDKMYQMLERNRYKFPHFEEDDLKRMVYSDLYIEFVRNMAEMEVRFNDNFELV